MPYRWPYRSEPIDPVEFFGALFIILLNLMIFGWYLYFLAFLIAPDFMSQLFDPTREPIETFPGPMR